MQRCFGNQGLLWSKNFKCPLSVTGELWPKKGRLVLQEFLHAVRIFFLLFADVEVVWQPGFVEFMMLQISCYRWALAKESKIGTQLLCCQQFLMLTMHYVPCLLLLSSGFCHANNASNVLFLLQLSSSKRRRDGYPSLMQPGFCHANNASDVLMSKQTIAHLQTHSYHNPPEIWCFKLYSDGHLGVSLILLLPQTNIWFSPNTTEGAGRQYFYRRYLTLQFQWQWQLVLLLKLLKWVAVSVHLYMSLIPQSGPVNEIWG